MSFLGLYRDPVVARGDAALRLAHRRSRRRRAPDDALPRRAALRHLRTKPLIRLILNQIGRRLTEDLHAKGRRHRCC
jgi:type IV secretion system protein VirD4